MSNRAMTTKNIILMLTMAFGLWGQASRAEALTPLAEEKHINDSLIAAAIGDQIRKNCGSISPRWFTVYGKMQDLKSYAIKQGYKEDDVRAFLKDKDEKARVKGLAADYMKANGVVEGNAESYCALGRAEMAKGTLAGSLLK